MAEPRDDPRGHEPGITTADLAQAANPVPPAAGIPAPDHKQQATPLLPDNEVSDYRTRWNDIQTGFVDEPRSAVEDADRLVATAMQRLAEIFSKERAELEGQWDRGDNVSTEDLRLALQRHRTFFERLLSI